MKIPVSSLFLNTAAVLVVGSGCSLLIDVQDEQCRADTDCASLFSGEGRCVHGVCVEDSGIDAGTVDSGGDGPVDADAQPDPAWSCLGSVVWPSPDPSTQVDHSVKLTGLDSKPIVGMDLAACGAMDVEAPCQAVATATTDEQGSATLGLFVGFNGQIRTDPSVPVLMPALVYVSPPLDSEGGAAHVPVQIPTRQAFASIAMVLGTEITEDSGHVLGMAVDCEGSSTAGVVLDLDANGSETTPFYMNAGAPSGTLNATTASGQGGFLNVPPGFVTVNYRRVDGTTIGSATILVIRGRATYPIFAPSP